MGSGENSPAMVTPHQNILKSLSQKDNRYLLDTPSGFQTNCVEVMEKIAKYFEVNVGFPMKNLSLENLATNEIAKVKKEIANADWVFAGPGSPTYALRIWEKYLVGDDFLELLQHGALVLSSAATIPFGKYVLPVYEIFKAGEEPHWKSGLDIFGKLFSKEVAIIPHFNNNQGGNYDTSCCFVGRERVETLKAEFNEITFVLGIDEHTGLSIDLDSKQVEVFGKSEVTVELGSKVKKFSKGAYQFSQLFDEF